LETLSFPLSFQDTDSTIAIPATLWLANFLRRFATGKIANERI